MQLLEREHGRCNKARKQTKAKDIECPAAIAPGARLQTQHKHHGGETDRKVDEKNRLPAQVLCEVAPGKWTEGAGADRDSRQITLIASAFPRRHRLSDQRLR